MNFTYFKFLFVTTIKKRPVWITWLLFILTAVSFLIILPAAARMNTLQVWANTTMAVCQTFLGMTIALFTAVLGIHIFKDGNEEGTELIVISKPISRMKIVLTKFFVFFAFCLMVNFSSILITIFTIFLPTTEIKFYWGLIISMLIGNLVTFGIFGSIAILLTVNFAKVGIIITNILISLIFLIYQALTLFVFATPMRSLTNHGLTAPSYIVCDRNTTDGTYKEDEVVCFNTNAATQITLPEAQRNYSQTWKDTADYWKNEICKGDPTPILNWTDWAGQLSLSYLSVGLDQYAYRQGYRFFAISRFYNYELTSPASPEIISGVENKKTLPWMYTSDYTIELGLPGETDYTFYIPKSFGFAGIAPLGTTRLRGYEDRIPVGFYVRTGEILSSKDVYFEPEQWKKYAPAFDIIYNNIFEYPLYEAQISKDASVRDNPEMWASAFAANNAALNRYYTLLWSCLTGNSAKPEYLNKPVLKDYSREFFDIYNVNDLNERFIQFKYYCYFKALDAQQKILASGPTTPEEATARTQVEATLALLESYLGIKHTAGNWMVQADENAELPFIEPGTQTVYTQLIHNTCQKLKEIVHEEYQAGDIDESEYNEILIKSTLSQYRKTQKIFTVVCQANEEYLFDSIEKPDRSAAFHGKAYMVSDSWTPYWQSLITPVGQNMQYFFYSTKETTNFWKFAIIWGTISIALFAAGAVVYNKYDVK